MAGKVLLCCSFVLKDNPFRLTVHLYQTGFFQSGFSSCLQSLWWEGLVYYQLPIRYFPSGLEPPVPACLPPRASHPASELNWRHSTPATIAPVVAVMFAVSQDPSGVFHQQSVVSRTAFIRSWHLKGTAIEEGRGLGRESSPLDLAFSQLIVPSLHVISSKELCLSPSSLAWEMPTNQSSPWNGGSPRHCSNVDKTTTMTTAPKVPYNQPSIELARSKAQAKAPACNAASTVPLSRLTTVAPPVFSVWEKGDKKTAECQITTVPHVSSNMPQQLNGIQIPKPILATGPSETNMATMDSALFIQKDCQVGLISC